MRFKPDPTATPARVMTRLRAAVSTLALLHASLVIAAPPADMVFVNGAVYTVDAARSWATALAVSAGQVTYVGDDATARGFIGPTTRVVDLAQRMLLPGFQDSHAHPADAPNPATSLDLHGLTDRAQIFQRVQQYAKAHPKKPWIVGDGWDKVAFLPSGMPTRDMLDPLISDRPVFLTDNSGHSAWVNSRALAMAHISERTAEPTSGRIERDTRGKPSGVLHEDAAMELVSPLIPPTSAQDQREDLQVALAEMVRLGITAVEDAMATPAVVAAYEAMERSGQLKVRANLCLPFRPTDDDDAQLQQFIAQRAALQGKRLSATCVKIFLDGAYASHTLVLLEPYSDEPRFGRGTLFVEQTRLNRLVARLDAAGFQIHMHTQGDGAVRAALDAFAAARVANGPRDSRHTLAHLCLVDPADVPRFRTLGVIANMTPLWSLGDVWEAQDAPRLFGPVRNEHVLPTRTLLDAGVVLAWGTDWPVTGVAPLDGLETAITHRYPGGLDLAGKEDQAWNPAERVGLAEAITAYTSAGAYLMHEEATRGSLSPGKAADFVVLERNLFDTPPLRIHSVRVDMTVIDGKVAYERAHD
ncbi:MAG: amidohydrolase [Pseudomonadota bacterium]